MLSERSHTTGVTERRIPSSFVNLSNASCDICYRHHVTRRTRLCTTLRITKTIPAIATVL